MCDEKKTIDHDDFQQQLEAIRQKIEQLEQEGISLCMSPDGSVIQEIAGERGSVPVPRAIVGP